MHKRKCDFFIFYLFCILQRELKYICRSFKKSDKLCCLHQGIGEPMFIMRSWRSSRISAFVHSETKNPDYLPDGCIFKFASFIFSNYWCKIRKVYFNKKNYISNYIYIKITFKITYKSFLVQYN